MEYKIVQDICCQDFDFINNQKRTFKAYIKKGNMEHLPTQMAYKYAENIMNKISSNTNNTNNNTNNNVEDKRDKKDKKDIIIKNLKKELEKCKKELEECESDYEELEDKYHNRVNQLNDEIKKLKAEAEQQGQKEEFDNLSDVSDLSDTDLHYIQEICCSDVWNKLSNEGKKQLLQDCE